MIQSLEPEQVLALLSNPAPPQVLDVREGFELELAPFPGAVHIPMGELTRRHGELDPALPLLVVCHHGVRSLRAAAYLASLGFRQLINLRGGIDAWSRSVAPEIPRY
jgi:rhodanese-related sulfurtransferase